MAEIEYIPDQQIIVDLFSGAAVGDVITFDSIADALGHDRRKLTSSVHTAIYNAQLVLEQDYQMVFSNIRGVGYKRLSDEEIVDRFEYDRRKLRKRAQRAASRLLNVQDFRALSPERRLTHQAALGVLAAISRTSSPAMVEAVKEEVKTVDSGKVPIGRILELMINRDDSRGT